MLPNRLTRAVPLRPFPARNEQGPHDLGRTMLTYVNPERLFGFPKQSVDQLCFCNLEPRARGDASACREKLLGAPPIPV
jgi:hypothetical protein